MLAQLTARLRARQGGGGDLGGGLVLGQNGEAVLVDDNCMVSLVLVAGDDEPEANRRVGYVTNVSESLEISIDRNLWSG